MGSPIELDAKISVAGAIFKWYKNGVEIDDETGSTLSVTTDGTYGFEAILDSGCSSSDEIIIEFATPPKIATAPKDILLCESDGNSKEEFDFSGNEALILGTQLSTSFPISYHKDETAAKENLDPLNIPYENTLAQETIWVRIAWVDSNEGFELRIISEKIIDPSTRTTNQCYFLSIQVVLFNSCKIRDLKGK